MTRATTILRWTARQFGDDVTERVFVPLVADWQRDVASAQGELGRARARIRGGAAFVGCVAIVGTQQARPDAGDWPRLARSGGVLGGFLVAGVALLLLPFVPWWLDRGWTFAPLALDLLPTTLSFVWPFALVPAAAWLAASTNSATVAWRSRAALSIVTAGTIVLMVAMHTWVAPAAAHDFRRRITQALPGTPSAINPPALRLAGLSSLTAASPNESRRRQAMTFVWPGTLILLGWRAGWHRGRMSMTALVAWWLAPVGIALAFQPAATPFGALHPMQFFETPEFSAAAVWLAVAMALRPRGDYAGVRAA